MKSTFRAEDSLYGNCKVPTQHPKYGSSGRQGSFALRDCHVNCRSARRPATALVAIQGIFFITACGCLTGCFGFLKPAASTARHFLLTSVAATNASTTSTGSVAVGVGQVKIPAYLFDTSLAVREDTNEIAYLPSVLWAERLDVGFQRVLAANLASLLPSDRVRMSAWRADEISSEIYVQIQQFDVDSHGRCVLVAWWRIVAPAGEKILKTGQSRLTRQGPPPESDPSGAVAALSELAADFSGRLVQVIKELSLTHTEAATSK